jgi:predicted MFS family arabinose efflux permease
MVNLNFQPPQRRRFFSRIAWVLASLIFINRVSAMVKLFMALYLRQILDLPIEWVGWLLSGYGAGVLIGSLGGGILSDHVPCAKLTVMLLFGCCMVLVLLGLITSVYVLAGLLLMGGVFDGAVRTLHQRLIMEYCDVLERPRAQALNRVAANLGMAVAGVMGGALAQANFRWLFFFSAAVMFSGLVWFACSILRYAAKVPGVPDDYNKASQKPCSDRFFIWLLAASVLLGLAFEPVYSMLGNYLIDYYQLSANVIGWQFALNAALIVVLQIPISHWTERWGPRRQILTGSLLLAVGLGMLPFGAGLVYVPLSTTLWTLGEILFLPTLNVLVMQFAQSGKSGHYFGFFSVCWSASALLAPALGGQIYGMLGGHSIWVVTASLAMLSMPFIYQATRFNPRISEASGADGKALGRT